MSIVATRRLIAASASLDPAERALLNLWVNRGLDDPALARMTGMSTEAIAGRREKIVADLSQELGLPPAQIRSALDDMAASSLQEHGDPGQASSGSAVPAPEPDQESAPSSGRKRGYWVALGLAVALVVVIVLVLALGSGTSKHRLANVPRTPTATTPTTTTTPTTPTATTPTTTTPTTPTTPTPLTLKPTPPATPAGTASIRHRALVPLPGGDPKAYGFVKELGKPGHLRLRLILRNLPPARGGHYEIWLYNSILDSRAMASLPKGVDQITLPLGRHAPRYHWIDISFQPRGTIAHSGQSVLRATNPDQPATP